MSKQHKVKITFQFNGEPVEYEGMVVPEKIKPKVKEKVKLEMEEIKKLRDVRYFTLGNIVEVKQKIWLAAKQYGLSAPKVPFDVGTQLEVAEIVQIVGKTQRQVWFKPKGATDLFGTRWQDIMDADGVMKSDLFKNISDKPKIVPTVPRQAPLPHTRRGARVLSLPLSDEEYATIQTFVKLTRPQYSQFTLPPKGQLTGESWRGMPKAFISNMDTILQKMGSLAGDRVVRFDLKKGAFHDRQEKDKKTGKAITIQLAGHNAMVINLTRKKWDYYLRWEKIKK